MKISPVQGTPTIPNLSPTGLSPEKLAMIKAIAGNQPPPEPKDENETIKLGDRPTSTTQRILMNTNRSQTRPINDTVEKVEDAAPLEAKEKEVVEPTLAISDKNVQDNQPKAGVTAKPEPEAIGTVSPELAALAREKRSLQLEREQLAKDKQALQGQSAEGLIKRLKTNALSVLQEQGITYEQLTNEILQSQGQQPQDLSKFKEDLLKEIDTKLSGKDDQQEEAVYDFMKQEVDKLSFSSNDYKLIRETKSQSKVMDLVKRAWKGDEKNPETFPGGVILTENDAMDMIEKELREDAKRYAQYLRELEPTKAPEETPPVQATGQKTKTLTNKDSASRPMNRRQRAIAAALGQK